MRSSLELIFCVALLAVDARVLPVENRAAGGWPTARYFTQQQDHFTPANNATWQQPYFVNDTFHKGGAEAPVFMCVGGEGPPLDGSVVVDSVHCNVAVEWLQEMGAIMFAVEHRYYSCHNMSACPVSTWDGTPDPLAYLSSRQALADLAGFHAFATKEYGLEGAKWVSWGGSYPGMLAGWSRIKYPELFHAAVASSAPVRAEVDMIGYFDVVAQSFNASSAGGSRGCLSVIAKGHETVGTLMDGDASQRDGLAKLFDVDGGGDAFKSATFKQSFAGFGVVPFPGQSNDPSCETPFCNVAKVCSFLTSASGEPIERLALLYKAMMTTDVHFRSAVVDREGDDQNRALLSGQAPAANPGMDESPWYRHHRQLRAHLLSSPAASQPDFWSYQTCNEFAFYQTCEVGSGCMFTQGLITLPVAMSFCEPQFGISTPQVHSNVAATNAYYGADHPDGSRVLWPNGQIDPWHANSVLKAPSKDQPTLWVVGASHHFWTHPSLPTDSEDVVAARLAIRKQVLAWLAE